MMKNEWRGIVINNPRIDVLDDDDEETYLLPHQTIESVVA